MSYMSVTTYFLPESPETSKVLNTEPQQKYDKYNLVYIMCFANAAWDKIDYSWHSPAVKVKVGLLYSR